jgi:hypothetical protein
VTTLGVTYVGNRQQFNAGWRAIGGSAHSAYRHAPIQDIFWLEWRIAIQ